MHCWFLDFSENLINGTISDFLHVSFKVGILKVLNLIEHRYGSSVEAGLSSELGAGEEVDESSLLNELVFLVNSVVLQLFLGVSQELVLGHLGLVSPLVGHLSEFVSRINIVENGELWTNKVSEMFNLDVSKIVSKEELMMPDHGSEPVVVFPTAESGDGVDRSDIGSEEEKTSSGSCESLVMRGNLLWSNCPEQILHVVHV